MKMYSRTLTQRDTAAVASLVMMLLVTLLLVPRGNAASLGVEQGQLQGRNLVHSQAKRQAELVRCFTGPGDSQCGGSSIETESIANCCLGPGYFFEDGSNGMCQTCVVIGWVNVTTRARAESIILRERQGNYGDLGVDYIKGSNAGNTIFTVTAVSITTDFSDFTLSTTAVDLTNGGPQVVQFTLRPDNIALEGREEFQLRLTPSTSSSERNEFIDNSVNVTIVDSTSVSVLFTEIDFRLSPEDDRNLTATIERRTAITTPLSVLIYPITITLAREAREGVVMFQGERLHIPPEIGIPDSSMRRPSDATSEKDFDVTPIRIEMEPSDLTQEDFPFTVSVVADEINEASEFFILILRVESADGAVDTSIRNTTRCEIIDDDPIFISFEFPSYEFMEPQFDSFVSIRVVKSKNLVSEQIVSAYIQAEQPNASFTEATPNAGGPEPDFDIGIGQSIVRDISPINQFIEIEIQLFRDSSNVVEGVETFGLTLSVNDGGDVIDRFAPFTFGDFPSTLVHIIDRQSLTVGFERNFTSVLENQGEFELCVRTVANISSAVQFSLNLFSVENTADYADFGVINSSNNPLVNFTSNNSTHRQCFRVAIIDDESLEETEEFTLNLTLANVTGRGVQIIVDPSVSVVEIIDEDDLIVGFERNFTSVNESEGSLELCVLIMTNETALPEDFSFSLDLTSINMTADGTDYEEITSENNPLAPFTSDPSTHRQCFEVNVTNDSVLEDTETFALLLTLLPGSTVSVVVDPDLSTVEIIDDDVILVGFERIFTTVGESDGNVELCVSIFTEPSLLPENLDFILDLVSIASTADSTDYLEITSANNPLVPFSSNAATHRQCFNVNITDDSILEDSEYFSLNLTLAGGSTEEVKIVQDASVVEITDDDFIVVGFENTSISVGEEIGQFELCVRIFNDISSLPTYTPLNFTLGLVSQTGTAGSDDYVEITEDNSPLIPFTSDPSTHRQCFNVTIIEDGALEDTEIFSLNLTLVGGSTVPVVVDPDTSVVEIIDRDPIVVGFERTFTSVDEESGFFELCVRIFTDVDLLPVHMTFSFSLDLTTVSGTADSSDYDEITTSNNPLVPFTSDPSTHTQCFNVTIIDDQALEDTETFSLTLTSSGDSNVPVVVMPDVSNVEITDRDEILVGFDRIFTSVDEDVGTFVLCVEIMMDVSLLPTSFEFSLNLATINDSAGPDDYIEILTSNNPLMPFNSDPSTHKQCFNVTIINDGALEDTEIFSLNLTLVGSTVPVVVDPDTSVVEITDRDPIVVGFERIFTSVDEESGFFELCVGIFTDIDLLPVHINFSFSLDLTTVSGTADSSDYEEITTSNNPLVPFTSDPSTHRQCFNVTIINDEALEDTETFSLTLTSFGDSNVPVVVMPDVSNVEITDRDEIVVGFERIFTSVDEDVGSFELCVEILTNTSLLPNSFEFSLNLLTNSDTAGPDDYTEIDESNNPLVLFTSDRSTHRQCFDVTISDDGLLEDTERFNLSLSLDGSTVPVTISPNSSVVEVVDQDPILVGFDKNFTSVEEDAGSFQLCVLIFTDAAFFPSHTAVNFSLDLITVSGTADINDYIQIMASNNPLMPFTSDPSTHRQCFNVTIIEDGALEDTEIFSLNLTLVGGSTVPVVVDPDTSIVEIIDRDPIVVGFERIFTSVDEESGFFELCVRIFTDVDLLPVHINFSFSLDLTTVSGTADSSDYEEITTSNNPLVPFTSDPSTHRQCFNVTIINDRALEDTETFSLTLTSSGDSNVPVVVMPDVSNVEITDRDEILVGFDRILTSVDEDIGSLVLCVEILTNVSLLPTSFEFSLNLATINDSAGPDDYIEILTSNNPLMPFTSDPSTHKQCFNVTIINDGALEDTEIFSLNLTLVGSTVPVVVDPDTSVVEITDRDPIVVGFERIFTSVDEESGFFELCVGIFTDIDLLPVHINFSFSLDLTTVSGTADSSDYEEITTFNNPLVPFTSDPSTHRQCFNVTIIDDEALEDTETFSLTLTSSGDSNVPVVVLPDVSNVEITDRDEILVGFERIFTSVDEDVGSFELCVKILTNASLLPNSFEFSLNLLTNSDTAGPDDYTEIDESNNPLVLFTSDRSTHRQCFNVTISDDGLLEDTERFNLSLSLDGTTVPVTIAPNSSVVEVVDQDPILVGFDKNFTSVEEDVGSFELCVLIFTDAAFFPSHTAVNFSLDLITVSGTADINDYIQIMASNNPLMPFTSDPSTHRQCFNVTIIEDGTLEDVEIFSLNLTLVGGSTVPVVVDPDTSIVEIIDRDPIVVGFERIFTSVDEESGFFELCVRIFTDVDLLPVHINFSFSLDLTTVSGTADSSDYEEITTSNNPLVPFTSDPSTHRQCFNVTIINDEALEDTETFSLTLTSSGDSNVPVVVMPDVSNVEITDRDEILVGFDRIFTSVDEDVGSFVLCVEILTNVSLLPTSFEFSLNLATINDSAGPDDYIEILTSNNPLMPFTSDPSTHKQCFNVTIINDGALEDTEIFSLNLTLVGSTVPVVVDPDTSVVEITDRDPIVVGFERIFTSVDEESGFFELCVGIFTDVDLLPVHINFSFSLDLTTMSGTADSSDYVEITTSNNPLVPFTSDPSTHRQCFNVTIIDDEALEDTETFSLTLTSSGDSNVPIIVMPDLSNVEITDRDEILVGFERIFTSVDEDVGSFELCVEILTNASLLPNSFEFSLNLTTISDTAGPDDYTEIDESNNPLVLFTSDRSTHRQCFDVTISDDGLLEDTERFNLSLSLDGSTVPVTIAPNSSVVEVVDQDPILVGFDKNFTSVEEDVGSFQLCVLIFTDPAFFPSHTIVNFSLDLITVSGTADINDYIQIIASNNPLVPFTSDPSTHRQCFNVTIVEDGALEDTEIFSLNLTLVGGSTVPVVVDPDTSIVEIIDRDPIVVGFERVFTSVDEESGFFELCVRLFTDVDLLPVHMSFSFSLDLTTVSGTADSSDYDEIITSNNPLVPFTSDPSTHRQCFNVTIIDDEALEDTETFSLILTSSGDSNVPVIVIPDVSNVEIIDSDEILVGFERIFTLVDEDVGSFELCVEIFTDFSLLPNSFEFSLNLTTKSDTAGPDDYTEIDESNNPLVLFTSDRSTHRQCFDVTISDDGLLEDTERFNLSLSLIGDPSVLVTVVPDVSVVEIVDQDAILVGFEEIFTSVQEVDGSVELCVLILTNLSFFPMHTAVNFSLDLVTVTGTADTTDYIQITASNNPLVPFTSDPSTHRQCFNVTIIEDGALEDTEIFSLNLTLVGGSTVPVVVDPDTSVVEIIDRDAIVVGFERTFTSVDEDSDFFELCVQIFTNASSLPMHLAFSFSLDLISESGTADPTDYLEFDTANNLLVSFTADPSTHRQCFNVTILNDTALEDTENFTLTLTPTGDANVPVVIKPGMSVVQIIDDDEITIGFELTSVAIEETAGTVTLVISVLDGETSTPISIAFTTLDNGTASSPLDFMSVEQLLLFNETVMSYEIEVVIIDDGIAEPNEYFLALLTLVDPQLPDKVTISPDLATVTIVDGSPVDRVNDTIIGDPLLTVPILVTNLEELGLDQNLSLCYELHGSSDTYFNLVSDICTSVSAHYFGVSSFNVIDEIGVKAVDNAGNCRDILVSKEGGGTVTVDGEVVSSFSESGISVRKYRNHIRIAVPNCAHVDLVMWVMCQNGTLTEYDAQGREVNIQATMMRFVIARGFNLQQSSHGVIGQFWNVPVIAEPYNGTVVDSYPGFENNYYVVTVSHPDSPVRQFPAFFWPRSWEIVRGEYQPCLYAGSRQAGKTDEIEEYGDPVIEGYYLDYIVDGPFDTKFQYSRFEDNRCP